MSNRLKLVFSIASVILVILACAGRPENDVDRFNISETIECQVAFKDFFYGYILRCQDHMTGRCYLMTQGGGSSDIVEAPCPEAEEGKIQ